jgi:hypothetical protein
MNEKDRWILHNTYKQDKTAIDELRFRCKRLLKTELRYSGRLSTSDIRFKIDPDDWFKYVVEVAKHADLSNCPLTLDQLSHLVLADVCIITYRGFWFGFRPPELKEIAAARAESLLTVPAVFAPIEGRSDLLRFEISNNLNPEFLASAVIPYIDALAKIQRAINLNLESLNLNEEVVVRFISQQSEVKIGLEGVAETIDTLREGYIPWRREHAIRIADLKIQEAELKWRRREQKPHRYALAQARIVRKLKSSKLKPRKHEEISSDRRLSLKKRVLN